MDTDCELIQLVRVSVFHVSSSDLLTLLPALVKWSEGEVLKIAIHILPWPSATTVKPFSWFADKENQVGT